MTIRFYYIGLKQYKIDCELMMPAITHDAKLITYCSVLCNSPASKHLALLHSGRVPI